MFFKVKFSFFFQYFFSIHLCFPNICSVLYETSDDHLFLLIFISLAFNINKALNIIQVCPFGLIKLHMFVLLTSMDLSLQIMNRILFSYYLITVTINVLNVQAITVLFTADNHNHKLHVSMFVG